MPIFDLSLPDGRTLTLEAPDRAAALSAAAEWQSANPMPSTGADIAKSAAPALGTGLINMATLPRSVFDLGYAGGRWTAQQLGFGKSNATPIRDTIAPVFGPTAEQTKSTAEQITGGPWYKAQTPVGKATEFGLELVPGALAGPVGAGRSIVGGLTRNAIRYGMIPGVTGETAGQIAEEAFGPEVKPWVKGGVALATGGGLALADRPTLPLSQTQVGTNTAPSLGIPLSRGQANRNLEDQIMEQAALRGGYGPRSQQQAQDFFEQQRVATEAARGNIAQGFDRFGANIVDNPQAAAELAGETVRGIERQARAGYKSQYDRAFSAPGEFHAATFEGIGQKIKGRLTLGDDPVIVDDVTTPVANRALADIEKNISNLRVPNRADPFGAPNPENVVGINLKGVDQTRKRLIQFAQSAERGSADRRAVGRIIGEFDNEVEGAIANGLFSGDARVLAAIRNARQEYSRYRQTFRSRGTGDDVGRAMERIVGRHDGEGATAQEIAHMLYGEANVGAKGLSVRLAQRLRDVVGDASPEWAGIRQGLFHRLTHATPGATDWGAQKMAQRITEFLNGSGQAMSRVVFSPAERQEMARFAVALREQVPMAGAVNHSNTATVLSRIAANTFDGIVGMLGYVSGGPAGAAAALASRVGRQFFQAAYNDRRVMRTLYPGDRGAPPPVRTDNDVAALRTLAPSAGAATQSPAMAPRGLFDDLPMAPGYSPMTVPDVRAQYPQYNDMNDQELATALARKRIAVNPRTKEAVYYDERAAAWIPIPKRDAMEARR